MKTAASLLLTFVLTSTLHAQICDFRGKDSVVVKTSGDTLIVWDFAACANCGSRFVMTVTRSADSIQIVQTDTSSQVALCECIFDLSTVVSNVPAGTYTLAIYRTLPHYNVQHKLIKAVQVTLGGSATAALSWLGAQSACMNNAAAVHPADGALPGRLLLSANYPNPFNPTTTIPYELPASSHIRLSVVDVVGHEVALLDTGVRSAGRHEVVFNAVGLPSGVYFCRLEAGGHTEVQKMLLTR